MIAVILVAFNKQHFPQTPHHRRLNVTARLWRNQWVAVSSDTSVITAGKRGMNGVDIFKNSRDYS